MREYADKRNNLNHKHLPVENTDVEQEPVSIKSMGGEKVELTDLVLGLLFGFCGFLVISCFVYYYWKKYRHRQRILRIFG